MSSSTLPRGQTPSPAERASVTSDAMWRAHETTDEDERRRLWQQVTVANMDVARSVAQRFRDRGIAEDDLEQVAYVGLVYAVQHFDITVGKDFLSYAVPTIRGTIKKHFRDQGWAVRPPRRIQQLQAVITAAGEDLAQELGRSPRPSEIADHLGAPLEDVIEALTADGCYTPTSLDLPVNVQTHITLGDLLHFDDCDGSAERRASEARLMLQPVLRRLPPRDLRIVQLRFDQEWTQQEIADDLGVTQMQVSRLLRRIMRDLRSELTRCEVGSAAS